MRGKSNSAFASATFYPRLASTGAGPFSFPKSIFPGRAVSEQRPVLTQEIRGAAAQRQPSVRVPGLGGRHVARLPDRAAVRSLSSQHESFNRGIKDHAVSPVQPPAIMSHVANLSRLATISKRPPTERASMGADKEQEAASQRGAPSDRKCKP